MRQILLTGGMTPVQHRFFVTTAKGMEALLSDELSSWGILKPELGRSGVSFRGSLEQAYRVCLWSRIANRVLMPLEKFSAPTPEALYVGVKAIRWSDHLTAQQTIAVDFSSSHSQITHTQYGALKTKDAICDSMRERSGERPSVDVQAPDLRINVYVLNDEATISLDLSGDSLHRRGYRDELVAAPLKENLAAAMLMLADWPKVAAAGGALLDPMCGSGTIPIEAAAMAAHRAPGLGRRRYGFTGWLGHLPRTWDRLVEEARALEIKDTKKFPTIVGYDQDFRAVRTALAHVETAGFHGRVHIEKREFRDATPPPSFAEGEATRGIVVANPPYGERLGEEEALKPLYTEIGDTLKKKFPGWNGFVLTSNPVLAQEVGLKPSRRFVLFNGPLECRLLKYEIFAGSRRKDVAPRDPLAG